MLKRSVGNIDVLSQKQPDLELEDTVPRANSDKLPIGTESTDSK